MIDIGQADVLISEIVNKQLKIKQLEDGAKNIIERHLQHITDETNKWLIPELTKLKEEIEIANATLKPFVEAYLKDNPKKRSVKLPSGSAGFRKGSVNFNFKSSPEEKVDAKSELLLKLVKDHNLNNYIVTKESVNWLKLKASLNVTDDGKVISSDGEVLSELHAFKEPDSFYVKEGKND